MEINKDNKKNQNIKNIQKDIIEEQKIKKEPNRITRILIFLRNIIIKFILFIVIPLLILYIVKYYDIKLLF